MNPTNPSDAPDPARTYERAQPEKEAGMGRMGKNVATPANAPDRSQDAVTNRQKPDRQLNAQNDEETAKADLARPKENVEHSMLDEEPDGWDLAPQDIDDPRRKRHPKTDGKGGTP